MRLADDLLLIRTFPVLFYALRDAQGVTVIDGGFIGGIGRLRRVLKQAGWDHLPIRGIIVTHGHLDHILNVAKLARQTGAWIAAPRLDAPHYAGNARYAGWSRFVAVVEGVGKPLLRFQAFTPDRWLDDGDEINVWRGLRAVPLPGHTVGQMGFYCEASKLLFSADLFASWRYWTQLPPVILNSQPERIWESVDKALSLGATGILPNHGDLSPAETHLERLRRLRSRRK